MNKEDRRKAYAFYLERIKGARDRMWRAKTDFDERKRNEWNAYKKALNDDAYQSVWDADSAGVPVTYIAEAYGVSNRRVIYDIIKARPDYTPVVEIKPDFEVTRTDKPNQYKVTDGTHTVFVWGGYDAVAPYKYAGTVDTDSATALGWPMSKDPTHPAWAYVREVEHASAHR